MSQAIAEKPGIAAEKELIPNGDFSRGLIGSLPEGWTIGTRNPALSPTFEIVAGSHGEHFLQARGNGREECFGWVQTTITLPAKAGYRFSVRFSVGGLEDINRHLIHSIHSIKYDGSHYNQGIFSYRHDGDDIVGEVISHGPAEDCEVTVRLYFRHSIGGSVRWKSVSIVPSDPPPPRLVKIAVMKGLDGLDHWDEMLHEAGKAKCDLALVPEMFDQNDKPANAVSMEDRPVRMLAEHARRYGMYTCGALYVKRGDLVYNTAPLFDRNGELLGVHEKFVMYDPEVDNGAVCGKQLGVFQTEIGRVGIMTCYESWYPGVAQLLALKGAELILFPSAGYYEQLIHARAADNCVVIAASSQGCANDVWDTGGNRAGGETVIDPSRNSPTNIIAVENRKQQRLMFVTVDLSLTPSPHSWGGPMKSAPGGRRARSTTLSYLEDEISREIRRW